MADPNVPRVKAEAGATTIGGVARATFAPKIPARRKAGDAAAGGAAAAGSGSLANLITVKEERKAAPRARLASTHAPAAARVAFQPSQPGQAGAASSVSGDTSETRDVAVVVTNASSGKMPGQEVDAGPRERKPRVKGEGAAAGGDAAAGASTGGDDTGVSVEDISAEDAAEEAELAGMLATESSYDSFLDNGDLVQYRPILLPFPKVRMGLNAGRASTVPPQRAASASPTNIRPGSSQSNALSMFDIDEETAPSASVAPIGSLAARAASPMRPRSASPNSAPYKLFPAHSPARLLAHIDHEEKQTLEQGIPSQNLLFFQFPSHLPFKQAATWAPPVNPLLALTGNRQSSLGANTSAISFGATVDLGGAQSGAAGGAAAAKPGSAPASNAALAALQTLQNLSSPMMPPVAVSGLGNMPNLSLGAGAAQAGGGAASKGRANIGGGPSGAHLGTSGHGVGSHSTPASSSAADPLSLGSALGADEETDLGEVAKNDPNKLSDSERMAREHKQRQQRKLLLYSSNFEHAMRHLPAGQLGTLVIYKSGKIKLRVGDILLDVNEGVQCLFHQELMSVQPATGEAFRLGPVNHRLVCTNDVEDLVRKTRERDIPKPK